MKLTISSRLPLRGETYLPGDKSISHRAILLAGLAEGKSYIKNPLIAGVTGAMIDALRSLGIDLKLKTPDCQDPLSNSPHMIPTLTVTGQGWQGLRTPAVPINCKNSATTLRLLAGALAGTGQPAVLDGSPGLRRRPMQRIVDPLRQMGVPITSTDGHAPLSLTRRPEPSTLSPLDYTLPVASAQVKTCLLLAALGADGPTRLHERVSTRDHTERMLASMGVPITYSGPPGGVNRMSTITLTPPHHTLAPISITIPGDFSSAAFLIVAALITPGSEIKLRGVGLNPTRTGLLEALSTMGANIQIDNNAELHGEPVGDLTVSNSPLHGTKVDGEMVVRMIDEFPIFAIAAAFAEGPTTVKDASELRHKESDRITALCKALQMIGVRAVEADDGFTIYGGVPPHGGSVNAQGDHRLAMSLSVAGLAAQKPITVTGAEMIAESFPSFPGVLNKLGASLNLDPAL